MDLKNRPTVDTAGLDLGKSDSTMYKEMKVQEISYWQTVHLKKDHSLP